MADLTRLLNRFRNKTLFKFIDALWDGLQTGGAITVNGGANEKIDIAAATAMVQGVYVSANASTAVVLTGYTPDITTDGTHYRKVLITLNKSGAFTLYSGVAATSQAAAVKPAVPAAETEIGHLEIPNSFTAGVTHVTGAMIKAVTKKATTLGNL